MVPLKGRFRKEIRNFIPRTEEKLQKSTRKLKGHWKSKEITAPWLGAPQKELPKRKGR